MSSWTDYLNTLAPENNLHVLARDGNAEDLQKALSESNINLQDHKGFTPLTLACYHGNFEAAQFLIKNGADINILDHMGNTALMGAAFKGHLHIVKLLIDSGADIYKKNPQGMTARGFADFFGRIDVSQYLVSLEVQ